MLYYIILHYITLYCIILYCITLHYIILYHNILYYFFKLSYYNEYKSYLRYCTDDDVEHRNVCLPPINSLVYFVYSRVP